MTKQALKAIGWLVAAVGVSGCDALGRLIAPACTPVGVPAIRIVVTDSSTHGSVTSDSIVASVESGPYHDVVIRRPPDLHSVDLAYGRAGVYRVDVDAGGYAPCERTDVRVTEDECHVRTVSLRARMQPLVDS